MKYRLRDTYSHSTEYSFESVIFAVPQSATIFAFVQTDLRRKSAAGLSLICCVTKFLVYGMRCERFIGLWNSFNT